MKMHTALTVNFTLIDNYLSFRVQRIVGGVYAARDWASFNLWRIFANIVVRFFRSSCVEVMNWLGENRNLIIPSPRGGE